jgi:hypothetical protein
MKAPKEENEENDQEDRSESETRASTVSPAAITVIAAAHSEKQQNDDQK